MEERAFKVCFIVLSVFFFLFLLYYHIYSFFYIVFSFKIIYIDKMKLCFFSFKQKGEVM
jgi:hypothetical protein